ncbi:MAG: GldM family protein [Chitinophagaceae bacterium]
MKTDATFLRMLCSSIMLLFLLPHSGKSQSALIAATKMNILYLGVDNPVSICVNQESCASLSVVATNGSVKKIADCTYLIRVDKPGNTTLGIMKELDTIYQTTFRTLAIPDPIISISAPQNPFFSLQQLKGLNHFDLTDISNINLPFAIVRFDFVVTRPFIIRRKRIYCDECLKNAEKGYRKVVFETANVSGKFNSRLRKFIASQLQTGDRVLIENIHVTGADNIERVINPVAFTIY